MDASKREDFCNAFCFMPWEETDRMPRELFDLGQRIVDKTLQIVATEILHLIEVIQQRRFAIRKVVKSDQDNLVITELVNSYKEHSEPLADAIFCFEKAQKEWAEKMDLAKFFGFEVSSISPASYLEILNSNNSAKALQRIAEAEAV